MYVKVCGITQLDDALEAVRAGADALGFNCVPSSKRYLEPARIRAITDRLRVGDAADVARALSFPGHPLLVDAKVGGQLGGTGHTLDWALVEPLARARQLILAGGLTPDNVARAVEIVRPWGVDVASGVERAGEPRRKDPEKMRRFVSAARAAAEKK